MIYITCGCNVFSGDRISRDLQLHNVKLKGSVHHHNFKIFPIGSAKVLLGDILNDYMCNVVSSFGTKTEEERQERHFSRTRKMLCMHFGKRLQKDSWLPIEGYPSKISLNSNVA